MKIKSLLVLECICLVYLCTGCDNFSGDLVSTITEKAESSEKDLVSTITEKAESFEKDLVPATTEVTETTESSDADSVNENIAAYFPYQGDVTMRYGAEFEGGIGGEVDLKLEELIKSENGRLYQISYDNVIITDDDEGIAREEIEFYEQGRDLGYFWVAEDKIYFFEEISEEEIDDLCQNRELPELSMVVLQNAPLEETNKGEKAWHEYIKIKDNRVRFGGYNDMVETGFWRSIIWEKENGILVFRQGYGAGRGMIELYCKDVIEYDSNGWYGFE